MSSSSSPNSRSAPARRITVCDLQQRTDAGRPWAMITAYDALTAGVFENAGVPAILVGDSAAMVVHGHDSTLPISLQDLLPMVAAVVRGTSRALVVADLPFGSYQQGPVQALETATRFMKEAGAHAVKLEGGSAVLPQIEALVAAGIPVIGHLGLTPQSVNLLGGYRVQGRGEKGERLLHDAKAIETVGGSAVVLEAVPADLSQAISEALSIPTIGIGAGPATDAQVIVWQDLLGLTPEPVPRFVRRYASLREVMAQGVSAWVNDVETRDYPAPEHMYE